MLKNLLRVCAALFFCACASSGGTERGANFPAAGDLLSFPGPETLVIIGVTGRQSTREKEIDLAREDAARKAAMYHGVSGSVKSVQSIGAKSFDYYTGSEITLEYDTELEKYKDRLTFDENRDVRRTGEGAVFVRFSYPASFPGNIGRGLAGGPGVRPEWTRNPPGEIGGFTAGVGFSGRKWRYKDTFEKSCDSALAAIISQLSASVTVEETSSGSESSQAIIQESTGRLERFLVLEIWIDPDTRGVWTLAVARAAG